RALQNIDRRILYVLVALIISVPLVVQPNYHPGIVFSEVSRAYRVLDTVPEGKTVFISTIFSGSTEAENGEQTKVIVRHLFQKRQPFVMISWDQAGNRLSYDMTSKIADEMGMEYGTDWLHLGYRIPNLQTMLRGFGQDFRGTFKTDFHGDSLDKTPLGARLKNARDFGAVVEITPSATLESWIAYFCEPYHVPLVYCPAAVLAASAYPFLDTGQVAGMLNGVVGAAQYETLLGRTDKPTSAGAMSLSLSLAHIVILAFILLGNLAYWLEKRRRAR
ncbi:MAG: hypothetical protein J5758_06780, partial [Abditibacteriota bacterium]|nr:hypothetical protein [Abditibacteriota bacterium]